MMSSVFLNTLLVFSLFFEFTYGIPKLLVVSFDGFRYDYLNRNLTPNLNTLKSVGVYSKFMINVFPTQTFTNHFTLATGLYSEVHGVLASHVYDAKTKRLLDYCYDMFHYNEKILPIWTLNEMAGHHSGVMMWPGGDFSYANKNVTFTQSFNDKVDWEERVNTVMNWMKHPKMPANLVMLYFEEPDMESHVFGPDSKETNAQIARVDMIARYITDSLGKNGLNDVNVIFLSDHGMEAVPKNNIIDLTKTVGNLCDMYGTSPVLQVYPKAGSNDDTILKKLEQSSASQKNFKVYKKEMVPVNLHYKKCSRAPPIVVIAEPSYAFQDMFKSIEWYKKAYNISGNGPFGVHGYEPKTISMHPFFIAKGPIFKTNYVSKSQIESIDLYLLFSHVLQLGVPPIKPNGTLSHVSDIFKTIKKTSNIKTVSVVLVFSLMASIVIMTPVFIFLFKKQREKSLPSRSIGEKSAGRKDLSFHLIESEQPLLSANGDSFFEDGIT